jgi:hypothetical protein
VTVLVLPYQLREVEQAVIFEQVHPVKLLEDHGILFLVLSFSVLVLHMAWVIFSPCIHRKLHWEWGLILDVFLIHLVSFRESTHIFAPL